MLLMKTSEGKAFWVSVAVLEEPKLLNKVNYTIKGDFVSVCVCVCMCGFCLTSVICFS